MAAVTTNEADLVAAPGAGWRSPAVMLVLVAPLIGEVLNGATRLSYIFVFVPQVMVWGCGALLVREVVHRWNGGWISILMLGLALATAVELLILQTSLAPIPWLELMSIPAYGRAWGVNWPWLWFMLAYEAVWIVLVPILITQLVYPKRREDAWLSDRGLALTAFVFALGSLGLWVLWTQIAVPTAFKVPKYWPPVSTLVIGLFSTAAIVVAAYALRTLKESPGVRLRRVPPPWQVGAGAMLLALPWWALIVLVFVPTLSLPLWVPLAAGALWAAGAFVVIRGWSNASAWNDRHRWSLAFGALVACMLAGYLGSHTWPAIDLAAKAVLNVAAVERMIALARIVWRRT